MTINQPHQAPPWSTRPAAVPLPERDTEQPRPPQPYQWPSAGESPATPSPATHPPLRMAPMAPPAHNAFPALVPPPTPQPRSWTTPTIASPAPPVTAPRSPAAPAPNPRRHGGEIGREVLFRPAKRPPQSGWRGLVHRLSGGSVNPGESAQDISRRQLVDRVNQPIRGDYKIAILSLKGGVGKTTTTVGLGSTFAALRGDHVVAADANPDRGTLAARIPTQTQATVRDLLNDATNIHRYSDVRAFTSQAPSRLEVLASERDPHKAEAFSEDDYRRTLNVLEGFYNLILTDCGTGLTHSAMHGVLDTADTLVLVSSPALDGAQSADATLNWLDAQGYSHLVERTVVVISASRPGSPAVNMDQLVDHFASKVRAVQVIPFDSHLAEGSEVDLNRLTPDTRDAFVELAALVADDFPDAAGRHHGPGREERHR
jgi:MinD-like ATPase involved in chromosome partitioning or flagellar assembly